MFTRFRHSYQLGAAVALLSLIMPGMVLGQKDGDGGIVGDEVNPVATVFQVMDESHLIYLLDMLDPDTMPLPPEPVVLGAFELFVDSSGEIDRFVLSDSAVALFTAADAAFEAEYWETALGLYRELGLMEPGYTYVMTLVGHCFFMMGQHDSAVHYFGQALAANPVDYDALWFLGDALWMTGDTAGAVANLTRAHLLNVNHSLVAFRLRLLCEATGDPWEEWTFEPQYALKDGGDTIYVWVAPDWMGYGFAKAIWLYEPGYREMLTDHPEGTLAARLAEEEEALLCQVAMPADDRDARLAKILADGYLAEFVCYEILARKIPHLMMQLTDQQRERILEYVQKYH